MTFAKVVSQVRDILNDGIGWVAVYKDGRGWDWKAFYEESGTYERGYVFSSDDMDLMREILKIDGGASMLNGWYCNCGASPERESGYGTNAAIADGIEWNRFSGLNRLDVFFDEYIVKE